MEKLEKIAQSEISKEESPMDKENVGKNAQSDSSEEEPPMDDE